LHGHPVCTDKEKEIDRMDTVAAIPTESMPERQPLVSPIIIGLQVGKQRCGGNLKQCCARSNQEGHNQNICKHIVFVQLNEGVEKRVETRGKEQQRCIHKGMSSPQAGAGFIGPVTQQQIGNRIPQHGDGQRRRRQIAGQPKNLIGIDHIAFGSDFDGTRIPSELGDASGFQLLVSMLEKVGLTQEDQEKICHRNWIRVLDDTWK
jgi:hypothetical protein